MVSCKDVHGFLGQVSSRAVTAPLADADVGHLAQLGLVQVLTADGYRTLSEEVGSIGTAQLDLEREGADRAGAAAELGRDYQRDHSVLFHLHGKDAQAADLEEEAKARAKFQAEEAAFAQKQQAFNDLLAKRSMFDGLTPLGTGYVALTAVGAAALRDLTVRLYRYSDADFDTYIAQAQQIDQDLGTLATVGATYFSGLSAGIPGADRAYLWSVAIGLVRSAPDPTSGGPRFLEAYRATDALSDNPANRLMTSEILLATPRPLAEELPVLAQLLKDVKAIGVPKEAALGVAATVLFGRRADGSFATPVVQQFLQVTRSYESAALLGIVNVPTDALTSKFRELRSMFASWGYSYSEDSELSSAYLAVSEYAPQEIGSKLAILSRGLAAYLQYPLVAAAILTSVADLEANETLNLVEKAYAIVGRRAAGLSQGELICLAVRMVHGIRNELVRQLDATAKVTPVAAGAGFGYGGPRFFFLPVVLAHGGYYSTFGGISGVHPGHVHGLPGGFGGAGVG